MPAPGTLTAWTPPAGFTALFNGKDLSGWRGRPGGGTRPRAPRAVALTRAKPIAAAMVFTIFHRPGRGGPDTAPRTDAVHGSYGGICS